MRIDTLPPELLRYRDWPTVAIDMIPDGQRRRFNRLKSAVEAACDGKTRAYIERRWGVSNNQVNYLLQRCTAQHADGEICGYRAISYYFRQKDYERRSTPEPTEDGAGLAGAFAQLLRDHDKVHDWLTKRIRPVLGTGYREAGMKISSIHGEFLHKLRADGVKANEYPFSRKRAGYEALAAYLRRCADEFQSVAQSLHGRGTEAGLQARSGKFGVTRALHCYERVAYDEYELPNIATLVIEADDSEIDVPLNRAYFCPIVDFRSDAVLGYDVSVSLRIQSINLLRAVESSINAAPPHRLNEFADYPVMVGEGLPAAVVPEARGKRSSVLVVDNHLTHLANPVVGHLRRQTGMIISYGQVRRWIGRAIVEGLFSELQVQLSRLASSTGSGPGDPTVKDPVGKAMRYRIRLTSLLDLLDILVGQHNAKRQRRLKMRTPNEVIAAECAGTARLSIVPRFDDGFVARPGIAVEIVTRCVRGNRSKSKHPYVQLDESEYTNDILRQSWHMVNKVILTLHIGKDMRAIRAFLPDGTEFGRLEVCDHWRGSAHDRETRKVYAFLTRYPNGNVSEVAVARLERLSRSLIVPQPDRLGQVQREGVERFRVGDSYDLQFRDGLTGRVTGTTRLDVQAINGDRADYTGIFGPNTRGASTVSGAVINDATGTYDPPYPLLPGGEYQVGKRWSGRTIRSQPNGRTHRVEFEGRVLARENIEVPAGTFDTFKVQVDFVLEDGLRRRATFWSQPEWGIPLRMIVETRERRAVAPTILIRDVVARRRA